MTTTAALLKKVRMLERVLEPKHGPDIIFTMWCVDRGDGKNGFARFNINTPHKKTPLTDVEVAEMLRDSEEAKQ